MEEHLNEIEKEILQNGLKKTFTGSLEQVTNEMTSFFMTNRLGISVQEKVILIIKCDESKEVTMDDIGLISDTIQDGMNNKASIIMHIDDEPFSENNGFELSLYYLLEK
ncbi:hypothetical protein ACTS9U_16685 [Empedobacter falsenii]